MLSGRLPLSKMSRYLSRRKLDCEMRGSKRLSSLEKFQHCAVCSLRVSYIRYALVSQSAPKYGDVRERFLLWKRSFYVEEVANRMCVKIRGWILIWRAICNAQIVRVQKKIHLPNLA